MVLLTLLPVVSKRLPRPPASTLLRKWVTWRRCVCCVITHSIMPRPLWGRRRVVQPSTQRPIQTNRPQWRPYSMTVQVNGLYYYIYLWLIWYLIWFNVKWRPSSMTVQVLNNLLTPIINILTSPPWLYSARNRGPSGRWHHAPVPRRPAGVRRCVNRLYMIYYNSSSPLYLAAQRGFAGVLPWTLLKTFNCFNGLLGRVQLYVKDLCKLLDLFSLTLVSLSLSLFLSP